MQINNSDCINYNEEDVWYCSSCLSLKIVNLGEDELVPCYCGTCCSTDITTCDIDKWEELYRKRYKKNYLNKK